MLLIGKFDEAKAIYVAGKDKPLGSKPAAQIIRDDFAALRKAKIDTPEMKRIEALLGG